MSCTNILLFTSFSHFSMLIFHESYVQFKKNGIKNFGNAILQKRFFLHDLLIRVNLKILILETCQHCFSVSEDVLKNRYYQAQIYF